VAEVKEERRRLIELLPAREAVDALDRVRWLLSEEEELTEEELKQVQEDFAEIRRGEYVILDEVKRRLAT
jgi:predicted AAA+ superfamily ATPase